MTTYAGIAAAVVVAGAFLFMVLFSWVGAWLEEHADDDEWSEST